MRHSVIFFLAVLFSPPFVMCGYGQTDFRGPSHAGPSLMLFPGVQSELAFREQQKQDVPLVVRECIQRHQQDYMDLSRLRYPETLKAQLAITKAMNDEAKAALHLSDKQNQRFDQIVIQARGVEALGDPDIQRKLMMPDASRDHIKRLMSEMHETIRSLGPEAKTNPQAIPEKVAKIQREFYAKIVEGFDADRLRLWEELNGKRIRLRE